MHCSMCAMRLRDRCGREMDGMDNMDEMDTKREGQENMSDERFQAEVANDMAGEDRKITSPPGVIQFLPPGAQRFVPIRVDGRDNSVAKQIFVDASTAVMLQRTLEAAIKDWQAGNTPRPWIDENHQGERCVGFPVGFVWAGDDPKAGGVRMVVEWNGYGRDLLLDKAYNYFSPSLLLGAESNGMTQVVGFSNCIGGLVNEPAFKRIQQISAGGKTSAIINTEQTNNMPEDINKQVEALTASVAALSKQITELSAKAADKAVLTQCGTDIQNITKRLDDQATDANRRAAVAIVASAVAMGRIAPQDKDTQKSWEDTIALDPTKSTLLDKITPTKVLQSVTAGGKSEERTGVDGDAVRAGRIRARAQEISRETKQDWGTCWAMAEREVK